MATEKVEFFDVTKLETVEMNHEIIFFIALGALSGLIGAVFIKLLT